MSAQLVCLQFTWSFLGLAYDLETSCRLATRQTDRERERTEGLVDRRMEREFKGRFKTVYLVTESPDSLGHGQVTSCLTDPGAGNSCRARFEYLRLPWFSFLL